jgi:nucleoside diphosphate kinase/ADP-ribose pyrophosphatase YjhB (NUDIX family)
MVKDRTLVIIKPDAIKKNLAKEVASRIYSKKLQIVERKEILPDLEFLKKLYRWPTIFHPIELEEYLCSMPLPVWIIEGDNAIQEVLKIKINIRMEFGTDALHTLIHCSDSEEEFLREHALIFFDKSLTEETMEKTNNQVEVFLFKRCTGGEISFLMLKRVPEKGGFWQPITGNVEKEESFEEAATREVREETGIFIILKLINTGYSFDFFDDNRLQHEIVFGAEIKEEAEIILSQEHTEFKWVNKEEALNNYLKWPGNKEGLKKISQILSI